MTIIVENFQYCPSICNYTCVSYHKCDITVNIQEIEACAIHFQHENIRNQLPGWLDGYICKKELW